MSDSATPWTLALVELVYGILQARLLDWVAIPFFRGSSQLGDQTEVSSIADRFFTNWATREDQKPLQTKANNRLGWRHLQHALK